MSAMAESIKTEADVDPRVILMRWLDSRINDARDELHAEFGDANAMLAGEVSDALGELSSQVAEQITYMQGRIDVLIELLRPEIDAAEQRHPSTSTGKGKAKKSG